MSLAELEIIRELRALGALRIQFGSICVEFGAPPVDQSPQLPSPALSREDQYIVDAIRSVGGN